METLIYENNEIKIYGIEKENKPIVICHIYGGEGQEILNQCKKLNSKEFTLVTIRNIKEEDNMSPYPIQENNRFNGKADEYIKTFTNKIIPTIQSKLKYKPSEYILAGYSLAGLFAIYTMYKTNIFNKIITCSGSFWYPNFIEYIKQNKIQKEPSKIYFSIGDLEKNTKNKLYKQVEEKTKQCEQYYKTLGIQTKFELNKGNHFQDAEKRLAKGINWVLE